MMMQNYKRGPVTLGIDTSEYGRTSNAVHETSTKEEIVTWPTCPSSQPEY